MASLSNLNANLPIIAFTSPMSENSDLLIFDSGLIVPLALNGAAPFDVALPPPVVGLNFRFIIAVAGTRNCTITPTGGTFYGVLRSGAAVIACANKATIVLTAANLLVGDTLNVFSDGVKWYVQGSAYTAAAFA